MSELKPLPCWHCETSDTITTELDEAQGCKWGYAACSCGARGPDVRTGYDGGSQAAWRVEAITAWNTRPTEDRLVGALQEAERAFFAENMDLQNTLREAEQALEALKAKVAPLVELAEKATPGPWEADGAEVLLHDSLLVVAHTTNLDRLTEKNAAYIAATHPAKIIETATDIDAALTRIRAAKGGE